MTAMPSADCPFCGRNISLINGRFHFHVTDQNYPCPGRDLAPAKARRAYIARNAETAS